MRDKMRFLAMPLLVAGFAGAAAPAAQAQWHRGYGGYGGYHRPYYRGYDRHRGVGVGGALVGGLAAGALIGALGARAAAPPPVVYAPPPVVYAAPPPVVYAAPPPGAYYPGYGYGQGGY